MADIKSSLDIAMERASAIGGGGKDELAREEGKKTGEVLARKLLLGDIDLDQFSSGLSEATGPGLLAARAAAGEILLAGMPGSPSNALFGLKTLAEAAGMPEYADRVLAAAEDINKAAGQLEEDLALEMARDLTAAGIGGSAVMANPRVHPDYEQRAQAALGEASQKLTEAGMALLKALEG